ncbi:MAG: hypothetical protein SGJ11_05565 [Phycisphaerae bacterium]|nr:hypothetical protein [Phycisphaerae bacterium]
MRINQIVVLISACAACAACSSKPLQLDSTMKLEGSFRLDGPVEITMNMTGPSTKYTGTYVSEKLLERVRLNSTRADWLVAVFGEPDVQAKLDDGTEIWRWSYLPLEQQGAIVDVFSTGGKDEPTVKQSVTVIQLRDGVVIDKWRD